LSNIRISSSPAAGQAHFPLDPPSSPATGAWECRGKRRWQGYAEAPMGYGWWLPDEDVGMGCGGMINGLGAMSIGIAA
jgi:hypothetical protein